MKLDSSQELPSRKPASTSSSAAPSTEPTASVGLGQRLTNAITRLCIECETELRVGDNWFKSFAAKHHHKCADCYSARRKYNRRIAALTRRVSVTDDVKLTEIRAAIREARNGQLARKDGYVYYVDNPAWPGWAKIGRALDPYERRNGYQTGSPHRDYRLVHYVYSSDRYAAERQAHEHAEAIATRHRGEWFEITPEDAVRVLDGIKR